MSRNQMILTSLCIVCFTIAVCVGLIADGRRPIITYNCERVVP